MSTRARALFAFSAAAFLLIGCSRDLSLPAEPGRGRIDGSFDTQGYIPADGQDVVLVSADGARTTQRTSGGGLFTFLDVPPGDYYLEANLPGFAAYVRPSIKVRGGDVLALGAMKPFWLAGTPQEGIVTGKVRSESDGDTSGGQVEFLLQPSGTRVALSAIGMGGEFVQRVPPGTYILRASHPLFVMKESGEISVGAAQQTDLSSDPLLLALNPAEIHGSVLAEQDQATPQGIAGALVTLGNGATTVTAADGTFMLGSLPGGTHTVRVTLAGYHDPLPTRTVTLTPGAASTLEEPITVLLDRGTITGTVELSDNQQATGITVSLSGTSYSAVVSPDSATPNRGEFVIPDVPVRAAPYEVVARKNDYARASQDVSVVVNQTVSAGTLLLTLLQGDFAVDDGDATNADGYARAPAVKLDLSTFTTAASYRASEDPRFEGVDFQAFGSGTLKDFTLSTGEGAHTVYAQYRDALGSQSAVFQAAVVLDATAPLAAFSIEGTLRDGTTSTTRTSTTAVRLLLTTSGATHYLVGGDSLATCPATGYSELTSATLDHTLTGTGKLRMVKLCVRDLAGNVTGPLVQTIDFDGDAPVGCVAELTGRKADGSAAPAGRTANGNVTVTVSGCSETPSEIALSNTPLTCAADSVLSWSAFDFTVAHVLSGVEGPNTVYGCVRDAARNVAALPSAAITLDTTPPGAPLLVLDDGAEYVNASQVVARMGNVASAAGTASGATEWALSTGTVFTDWRSYAGENPRDFTFPGGDGTQVLYAVFRDDVGNTSAVAVDQITFDTAGPDTSALTLQLSPGGNGYTNSTSVVAQLAGASDAARMKVAMAADPSKCTAGDLLAAKAEPYSANAFLLLLSPAEGTKRACAQLLDEAGNGSAELSATIVLDTTPPTAPVIITPPKVVNASQANPFTVETSGPVTEAHFARYEQVGGQLSTWTFSSDSQYTLSFAFDLQSNDWVESGLPNTLQLRAVDLAGNVSATASVVIIKDTKAPNAVQMNPLWVSNGDGRATIHWRAGSSPDVVGHNVYYGSSAGSFDGVYADQGPSPVRTQADGVLSLSGLVNGAQTFVTVRPVDHAGNVGPESTTVLVEPNVVSPNVLATLGGDPWSGAPVDRLSYWSRFVVEGDRLFALAYDSANGGCEAQMYPTLAVIDLSSLVTPIQTGVPVDDAPTPQPTALLSMPEPVECFAVAVANKADLALDGRWAFIVAGTRLNLIDVLNPDAPVRVAALDFAPNQLAAIEVRGAVAFVSGSTGAFALNLAKLYDGDPTTFPTTADTMGGRATSGDPRVAFLSRNVYSDIIAYAGSRHFDATSALDNNAGTTWSLADASVGGAMRTSRGSTPVVFGNYAWQLEDSRLGVWDLTPMWSAPMGAPVFSSSYQVGGDGPFSVVGAQAFFVDSASKGVRIADFTTLSSPLDTGFMKGNEYSGGFATATFGQYLIYGDASSLYFAEIATPRSLRRVASDAYGVPRNVLRAGALVGGGNVLDLTNSFPPKAMLPLDTENCFYDEAVLGDVAIQAQGRYLRIVNLEKTADRNPATSPAAGTDVYLVDLAPAIATGVAVEGNRIIVGEWWPGYGTHLEVLSALPLLDRDPASKLSLGNLVGSLLVTPGEFSRVQVSMHRGRALVTLDDDRNYATNAEELAAHLDTGLYVVDLRAALDDDGATSLQPSDVQGYVRAADTGYSYTWFRGHRQSVGRGNYAYVASGAGLEVIDISAAMDDSPSTLIPSNPPRTLVSAVGGYKSLAVHGSYAVAVAQINAVGSAVKSFDVSAPLSARVVSSLPLVKDLETCTPTFTGATSIKTHSGVSIGGSRAYVTMRGLNWVIELE